MPTIDLDERQLTLKLVYCGPPLAGKTTNLNALHDLVGERNRGRLMTLGGADDRTLFFDLLPIFFRVSGLSLRIKVYTVPGQVVHRMTRRAVLRGVDGIVFVAHSEAKLQPVNHHSFAELKENLEKAELSIFDVPFVTQFNKRDVADAVEPKAFVNEPVELGVATKGQGVPETFLHLALRTWKHHEQKACLLDKFGVGVDEFRAALADQLQLP